MEEPTRSCPGCGRALGPLATGCFYCGPAAAAPAPAPVAATAPGAPASAPARPAENTHCPICKNAIPATAGPVFQCPACQSRLECLYAAPRPLKTGTAVRPALNEICINHPETQAVARCRTCRKAVCDTCVFRGPTGAYCPDCAVKPDEASQRASTGKGIWSLVCGVVSLLTFGVLMFASALMNDPKAAEALGNVLGVVVLGLSLAGIGLGFTSRDPARKQSLVGLFGIILNFLVLGIYVLLIVLYIVGGAE